VSQRAVNLHLGTIAKKQGRVARSNIGGEYATFPGVLGTAITKVCELEIARTGLTETAATGAGFRYVVATLDSTTTAGYWPEAAPMRIKRLAELGTGRPWGPRRARPRDWQAHQCVRHGALESHAGRRDAPP
jgi:NADPH-dependent 2,4-dienoyl-CoA reductase/sulfur reductase-like enzyme